MIQQLFANIVFEAFFTASKQGKTGLSVTVDVYGPTGTKIKSDVAATETGGGFYRYQLGGGSTGTAGAYRAVFKTSDTTVDAQHVPSLWEIGLAGVDYLDDYVSSGVSSAVAAYSSAETLASRLTSARAAKLDNLDATISSRNAVAPDNAGILAAKTAAQSVDSKLTTDRAASLDELPVTAYLVNRTESFMDGFDSAITAAKTAAEAVETRLTSDRATKLDNLDATISSRLAGSAYTAPDNAGITASKTAAQSVDTKITSTRAAYLDAAISSRLAAADYVPGDGSGGGGGSSVQLITGPLRLYSDQQGSDDAVEAVQGDVKTLALYLRDANGEPVPYDPGTLSATLKDGFGNVVIASIAISEIRPSYGIAQVSIPFTSRGRFKLIVKRVGGPSDISTFGPLQIHVTGS